MLALTSRFMLYDNPIYASQTIIYDYSNAEMQSNNNNGFIWDGVEISTYLVPRKAIEFINFSSIVSTNNVTFQELISDFSYIK